MIYSPIIHVVLTALSGELSTLMCTPNHLMRDFSYAVLGGNSGQPNGASETEEQDAARGEQTVSAPSGESRKVDHHFLTDFLFF